QEEQIGVLRVLADDVGVTFDRISRQRGPGLAEVGRLEHPRLHVPAGVAVERREGRGLVVRAGLDAGDPGAARYAGQVARHVRPGFAAVARHLEVAVVGAGPDHVPVSGRLADRIDRRVVLGGGVVHREAAGLELLLQLGVVGGEIGRDLLPRLALVARAEEELGAEIERPGIVRAEVHRRVPVEAVLRLAGAGQRLDLAVLSGGEPQARDLAALVLDEDQVRIARIPEGPEAVAHADVAPVAILDTRAPARRTLPGAVVLEPAIDVVG